jgi:hypothetical protein
MIKQQFSFYMKKCKVPEDYMDLIEEFKDCFAQTLKEIGEIRTPEGSPKIEFRIQWKESWDRKPYYTLPYNQTPEHQEKIDEYIKEQLDAGLIEPVKIHTPWQSSLTVVIKKPDPITGIAEARVCTDYGVVNSLQEKMTFEIDKPEIIKERLAKFKYFASLDIKSAYNNIPIPTYFRKYLAFGVSGRYAGKYQPIRMNFGGKSMPLIFANAMKQVYYEIAREGWFCQYFDDLTIGANSLEELKKRVRKVLELTRKSGMKLKLTKCVLGQTQVKALGSIISKGKIMVDPDRLKAIKEFSWPKKESTKEEIRKILQSFLGMANYIARFIPNLSKLSIPLQKVIKDGRKSNG